MPLTHWLSSAIGRIRNSTQPQGRSRRSDRGANSRFRGFKPDAAIEVLEERALLAAVISATLVDSSDNNPANPGDSIRYTATIANTGDMDATNVVYTDPLSANTTLVGGPVRVTPIAFDDAYDVNEGVALEPRRVPVCWATTLIRMRAARSSSMSAA